MRKGLITALLLPALALGGCTLFGSSRATDDLSQLAPRRSGPLVIPATFTLPPPGQAVASAPAR